MHSSQESLRPTQCREQEDLVATAMVAQNTSVVQRVDHWPNCPM